MFKKLQDAFWKALTPDLVPDEPKEKEVALPDPDLPANVVAALGGLENLASQQRVAVTRIRIQLRDASGLDEPALRAPGMPGVMLLADGVVHVLTPVPRPTPAMG